MTKFRALFGRILETKWKTDSVPNMEDAVVRETTRRHNGLRSLGESREKTANSYKEAIKNILAVWRLKGI